MTSIRARVTAIATAVVVLVLVATSFGLVVLQRHVLMGNVDEAIRNQATDLAAAWSAGRAPTTIDGLGDDDAAAQIVDVDGRVVASSANVRGAAPISDPPPAGQTSIVRTIGGLPHDGARFRVVSLRTAGPSPAVVHVAAPLDDLDESILALTRALLAAVPVIAAVQAVLVWWLVGRTLRPVEAIRAEVDSIGPRQLDRRVPIPPSDDEISRLAVTMNGMLTRIEGATASQQRFVADASHELRSPLTRMRTELEVELAHPDDAAATLRSVLDEVVGLQRLVDGLLTLAAVDAGPAAPPDAEDQTARLDLVVDRAVQRTAWTPSVRLDVRIPDSAVVRGAPEQLVRAMSNITDNAARYAAASVRITASQQDGDVVLVVEDDGPGIAADDQERVFQRFARGADGSPAEGSGLGLAIAREVVERHGGSIVVAPSTSGGARLVVTLKSAAG